MIYNNCDIKWLWFDLDDTLIDFTTNSRMALVETFHYAKLDRWFSDQYCWIRCYEKHNHALWDAAARGEITSTFLKAERFRRPLVEAGMPKHEAYMISDDLSRLYLNFLANEKELVPGAVEALSAVRRSGTKVGILSNGFSCVQGRKIERAGLTGYIDRVVLSDDIDIMKPDVRLYKYAMETVGVQDPSQHIMIGDNINTDIKGALDAGWTAFFLQPRHGKPRVDVPDGVVSVDSLFQAIRLLGI